AQSALRKFNEDLESIVVRRTEALKEQIDQRHQAQIQLQRTNDELIKRNAELDNFVYSISHDLRAPITSILGLVNLAKVDKGSLVKPVYLEKIEKSALRQDYFIREIMDQSQNRRSTLTREPIEFCTLIDEVFN